MKYILFGLISYMENNFNKEAKNISIQIKKITIPKTFYLQCNKIFCQIFFSINSYKKF